MKALMIGVLFLAIAFGLLMMYCRGLFSTRYAPRYSAVAFQRIQAGDRTNSVIELLGEPLNKFSQGCCWNVWEYTQPAGLGGFWRGRKIFLSNDVVVQKSSSIMD
jgi:hypothetical protein